MLAATSRRDNPTWLFEVVLRSTSTAPGVGEALHAHALQVLRAACDIAADPSTINAGTIPEAIELALCLRGDSRLRVRLHELRSVESIQGEVAQQLLQAVVPVAS